MDYCPFPAISIWFILVIDHQPLRWMMRLNKLIGKFCRWALLLHEYNFEVVHYAGITNLDADGLSRNSSPSDEDLTGAKWHGDCDGEAIPSWYATAYLICFLAMVLRF